MLGKHLSMPWRIAFLSLDQLPRFCSPHLQCCEISLRVPLTWNMLPVSPPLRHLTFFFFWSQALASFMPISSAWLSSPGYTEFQVVATSAFPEWEISSITAFYIQSKFFFQHYHFSFSLSLSLFSEQHLCGPNALFWLPIFGKCHVGLSPRNKKAPSLYVLLSVCEFTDPQGPTSDRHWKKWLGHGSRCSYVIYLVILGLESNWQGLFLMQLLTVTIQGQLKSGLCD